MKAIFTEGSLHHLKTMEIQSVPRIGDRVVVGNDTWTVDRIVHLPKVNGRNDNEDIHPYDPDRDADITVHLVEDEE